MSTGFETQTLEGWTSESSIGNAAWTVGVGDHQTTPGTHSGSYNAKVPHTTNGNETWLISPMMNLANVDIAYLDFWYINRSWGDDVDELGVYYRIDEGDWNLLFLTAEAHGTWTNERVNLALLATNDNCQIGFKMTDHYGYGVGLDDIQISGYKFAGSYVAYSPAQSITFTNLNPNTTYTFYMRPECDGVAGTATEWIYFTTLYGQTIALSAGWNWVSFNAEITMADLQAGLLKAYPNPGVNALVVKAKGNGQSAYNPTAHRWVGSLSTLDLSQMYMVKVPTAHEITVEGMVIDPADYPLTIAPGVNWIAFPLGQSMSITDAFAGFPTNGDVVKAKGGGQATWNSNANRWIGGIANVPLQPGQGYIYNSKATGNRTFTFPVSAK